MLKIDTPELDKKYRTFFCFLDRTIIARIEEIIEKLVKIPEVLANIQTILFPALVQLLQVRSSTNGNLKGT